MIRVRSPAKVCSAFSSNVVRSSKYFSTLAALLVPNPMSSKAAPNVNAPFGMSIRPAPTPANMDSSVPTLLTRSSKFKPVLLLVSTPTAMPTRPPSENSKGSSIKTLSTYFILPSSPRIGTSVEFLDQSGTKRLRADISSSVTSCIALNASTVPYGTPNTVDAKPNILFRPIFLRGFTTRPSASV